MIKKCRDCGREFTLSDGEIEFYRSKNLQLPNRCKECREKRKGIRNEAASCSSDKLRLGSGSDSCSLWHRAGKKPIPIVPIAAAVLFAVFGKLAYTNELPYDNSEVTSSIEISINEDVTTVSAAKTSKATSVITSIEEEKEALDSVEVSDSRSEARVYYFRSEERLDEHFEKHGREMGFSTAKEYEAAASAVVNNSESLHKKEKEDGDDVYYLESSNELVIVSTDGYIRTYFYPEKGKNYYDSQ